MDAVEILNLPEFIGPLAPLPATRDGYKRYLKSGGWCIDPNLGSAAGLGTNWSVAKYRGELFRVDLMS